MDENGILLKWAKAKQKCDLNISSYLSWLGLIKSIPTVWKFSLRDSLLGNALRIDLRNESMACISSKMVYQKLTEPLSKPPTSQLYFEKVQGGMGKSLHVAKDSYNRVLSTFISV